jgi:hypothetical protein
MVINVPRNGCIEGDISTVHVVSLGVMSASTFPFVRAVPSLVRIAIHQRGHSTATFVALSAGYIVMGGFRRAYPTYIILIHAVRPPTPTLCYTHVFLGPYVSSGPFAYLC